MKIVYVCHPFHSDPSGNANLILGLCRRLAEADILPLAPQILLPQFLDESVDRELALSFCLRLVSLAQELRVYGEPTEGMCLEITEAERLGIPVVKGELP